MSPTRRDLIRGALGLSAGAALGESAPTVAAPGTIHPDVLAGLSAEARGHVSPWPLDEPFWDPYGHQLAKRLDRVKSAQPPSRYVIRDFAGGFTFDGTNPAGLHYGFMVHDSPDDGGDPNHRVICLDGRMSDEAFDAILGMFLAAAETYRECLPAEHEPAGAAD